MTENYSYLSKRGYVVRKMGLTEGEYLDLKHELQGRPLVDSTFGNGSQTFPLYIETQNKMYIPKMYGIRRFGTTKQIENYIGKEWGGNISFTGSLYDYQLEAVDTVLRELTEGSSGAILSLGTGFGKSVCGLYLLSKLAGKTLIIVNKISLLKQWEDEIMHFLPDARIGFIQGQSNVDVHDKDIVIAMLQSLSRIDYPDALFSDFRVTLVDEIHNVCSRVFSKVLMKVCSKYTIGLSATPKRSDGCEYVFKWFIGDIAYQSDSHRSGLPPIIHTVSLTSSEYREIRSENKICGREQIMFTSMLTELVSMKSRNQLICEMIKHYIKDGRRILVLSDRRQHVKGLHSMLKADTTVDFTYGLFIGQMKFSDLQKGKASQVILATYQAFGEGVSEKNLDTLFLITPKKFIGHLKATTKNESGKLEQIVGRIFRKEHKDINPLIVDINDNFSVYRNQSRQRMQFYKQHFHNAIYKWTRVDLDNENIKLEWKKHQTESIQTEVEQITNQVYTTCLLD